MKFIVVFLVFIYGVSIDAQEYEVKVKKFNHGSYQHTPVNLSLFSGISLADYIYTNKNFYNNFSLNLLSGSGHKLRGFEVGLIWNHYFENAKGIQVSGLGNYVEGDFFGVQASGIVGINGGSFEGIQTSGVASITESNFQGLQVSGVVNYAGLNYTGAQIAPIVNICEENLNGMQIAIITNRVSNSFQGMQLSTFYNYSKDFRGLQLSSFVNKAEDFEGMQLSFMLNSAKKVKGLQIGLLNFAEEIDGVSLGLITFVEKQGFRYDVWSDDLGFLKIGLRSGNEFVHNLAYIGFDGNDKSRWSLGYSFGSHFQVKGIFIEPSLSAEHINEPGPDPWTQYLHMVSKAKVVVGVNIADIVALYIGPTFNYYLSSVSDGSAFIKHSKKLSKNGKIWENSWSGFVIGFRIL